MSQQPNTHAEPFTDEPDIVRVIIERIAPLVADLDRQRLVGIEAEVRAQYGGMRVRIHKRGKYLPPQRKDELRRVALANTSASNEDLIRDAGISRRTWYRMIKERHPKPPDDRK